MKTAIITANTKGYQNKTESKAGKAVQRMLEQAAFQTVVNATLPEDEKILTVFMNRLIDDRLVDVIFTIGSNGVKKTDIIPETTMKVVDRLLPGIPEAIRAYNIRYSKRHMSDRSVAGVKGSTLVINLPETPKAAQDSLEYILPELPYIIEHMK
ncbi:MAG: molybdopterin-binding protein [Hespellia sp.]|nr:molybdopterin-binding protein [Hespellia sp.]